MKTTNIRGWHIVVGYLLALGIALLFVGCATTARKNEQAYQRVLTDSTMFRSIGQRFAKLQPPCVSDTIIGETEVLILSDTQYIGNTDTLRLADTIRINTTKTNTVTKYVVDNRAIHELQDSFHAAQVREAQLKGQIVQLKSDKAEHEKRAVLAEKRTKQVWLIVYGIIVIIVLYAGYKSFPSIRKAIGI